jgi:predicted flap endonuclease-1-like 5' DNA nuclease
MGLVSVIKSVLGLGDTDSRSRGETAGTTVTVEREADATSERAVKESTGTRVTFEDEPEATSEKEPDGSTDDPGEDPETETFDSDVGESDTPDGEDTADGASVEEIKGIGPAYAERLADAGVHTVSELAAADATDLSPEIGVGESRVADWIERANDR